ncbi:RcnB family protein, partial [Xanthomonas perforans]
HGPVYVVNDYDRYDLRRPPYGYRWQRDDRGNLLLVAIATGIIADLVLNN